MRVLPVPTSSTSTTPLCGRRPAIHESDARCPSSRCCSSRSLVVGTIAVDVKAKRVYRDALIIDAYEHRTLLNFETFFNTSVWFACFPPDEPHTCHLFLNRSLAGLERSNLTGEAVIAVPLKMTRSADERRDFMAALMGAISLR